MCSSLRFGHEPTVIVPRLGACCSSGGSIATGDVPSGGMVAIEGLGDAATTMRGIED